MMREAGAMEKERKEYPRFIHLHLVFGNHLSGMVGVQPVSTATLSIHSFKSSMVDAGPK